jgi:hypothetical protein
MPAPTTQTSQVRSDESGGYVGMSTPARAATHTDVVLPSFGFTSVE